MSEFDRHRGRCFGIAYRMLGSATEADDIVQEAYLRWQSQTAIENEPAWLTTVVTRLCLDHLKSARVRREQYVGPWLPEPILAIDGLDVASISTAMLLVLERLSGKERAAFVLRTAFDLDYADIAAILACDIAAVRQLHSRALSHLAAEQPRFAVDKATHAALFGSFLVALQTGDTTALLRVLSDNARVVSDGGGKAMAATRIVRGAQRAAKLFAGLAEQGQTRGMRPTLIESNGAPALALWIGDSLQSVVIAETDDAKIHSLFIIVNPDKLQRFASELARSP